MQYPKGALTFQQQLDLMVSRGLEVADQARALEVLQCVSYYRLAGYWYGFRLPGAEDFEPGAAFDEALRLYEFDRRLRLLVRDAVERLEVALRTAITYEFGHQYGAFGHLDAGASPLNDSPATTRIGLRPFATRRGARRNSSQRAIGQNTTNTRRPGRTSFPHCLGQF
jgi:abortive infection bacteriophage resistance protein